MLTCLLTPWVLDDLATIARFWKPLQYSWSQAEMALRLRIGISWKGSALVALWAEGPQTPLELPTGPRSCMGLWWDCGGLASESQAGLRHRHGVPTKDRRTPEKSNKRVRRFWTRPAPLCHLYHAWPKTKYPGPPHLLGDVSKARAVA